MCLCLLYPLHVSECQHLHSLACPTPEQIVYRQHFGCNFRDTLLSHAALLEHRGKRTWETLWQACGLGRA